MPLKESRPDQKEAEGGSEVEEPGKGQVPYRGRQKKGQPRTKRSGKATKVCPATGQKNGSLLAKMQDMDEGFSTCS